MYKMRENLQAFGEVTPNPAQFQMQGRPRKVTPKTRKAVLDFLFENDKLTYINEVKFFLKDEYDIKIRWEFIRRLIKGL
jgi:transposase